MSVTVQGEKALFERAAHLFADVRDEFVCAAEDMWTWSLPGSRERLRARRAAVHPPGTRVCKLYTPRALDDEDDERHLVEVNALGVEVRVCLAPLPYETIIMDRRHAVLAGPPARGVREYTIVQEPTVVASMLSLYWATWEKSPTLTAYRRDRVPSLNDESREIVRLLDRGLKDEAAARHLNLSLRTYRRRVAEILTLLDADSRFQAGRKAQELGLLP
ncbi:helix-turn-helix transcriptional regulator [Actinomadura atramentaria]|uniref:helix-turn-helix transcriptional regulator n=1 Tax=Actinomadura atramentaria TaxID=1990 RepID=UPI0005268939|nr:response regulator transcription factor [Actinomadura atramentaria]